MSYVYPYSFYSIPILPSSATYMYKSYTRKLVKSYIVLKLYAIKIIPVELIFTQIMSLSKLKKLAVPLRLRGIKARKITLRFRNE